MISDVELGPLQIVATTGQLPDDVAWPDWAAIAEARIRAVLEQFSETGIADGDAAVSDGEIDEICKCLHSFRGCTLL